MISSLFDIDSASAALSLPGIAAVIVSSVCLFVLTSRRSMPGPFPYPIIGNTLSIVATGDIEVVVRRWAKRYGKVYQFVLGGKRLVVLSDPEDLRHVMMSNKYLIRRENIDEALEMLHAKHTGIVSNNNIDLWKMHRRMFSSALAGSAFQRHAARIAARKADVLLRRHLLPNTDASSSSSATESETTANVSACLKLYSLDVIGTLAFGKEFGALEEGEDNELARAVVDFFAAWNYFALLPPVFWKIRPGRTRQHKENVEFIREVGMKTLAEAREAMLQSSAGDDATSFPTLLLRQKRMEEETGGGKLDPSALSDDMLCTDIREMLTGGTDTTSNLLAFTFYALAKYPELTQRVRKEIECTVPADVDDPSFLSSLSNLPYTDAFVKEVARMHPVVPIIIRTNTEDNRIGSNFIPRGTSVVLNQADSCLDPKAVREPDSFIPDRWLDKAQSAQLSRAVFPFGYGGRSCPGQHVAWVEIRSALSRILPKVEIGLDTPGQKLETVCQVVSHPKDNVLMLKFSPRKAG